MSVTESMNGWVREWLSQSVSKSISASQWIAFFNRTLLKRDVILYPDTFLETFLVVYHRKPGLNHRTHPIFTVTKYELSDPHLIRSLQSEHIISIINTSPLYSNQHLAVDIRQRLEIKLQQVRTGISYNLNPRPSSVSQSAIRSCACSVI